MHWLRTWLRWRTVEPRVDRELQFHLDEQVRTYVAEGMSPEAAHRRARVAFGGVQQIKEECRDVWTGISDLPAPDGPFIHLKAAQRTKRLFVTASSRFRGRQLSAGGRASH